MTRTALASERHLRFVDSGLAVSAIFFWFKPDFVTSAGSVQAFLRKFSAPAVGARIQDDTSLSELPYDWALNRAK